jgi:hypothetical protein
MKPYKPGESKISKAQWDRLNEFFKTIERPAQDELFATGDHYTLYLILRNELGFRPPRNAIEVYEFAEQVLLEGWE